MIRLSTAEARRYGLKAAAKQKRGMNPHTDIEETLLRQIEFHHLPKPERQVKVIAGRKFAFDFGWRKERLLVEAHGATFTQGRHTRGVGFRKDREKMNLATLDGWRVLEFDRKQIESWSAVEMIKKALYNNPSRTSGYTLVRL